MRSISSFRAVDKKCTMRFLIVATAVLACATAAPSGALLAAPLAYTAPVARLAPALPTISAGDINGAAIDAHVEASDHWRAAVDAGRQLHDKASEINGLAINNAEEHAWRSVDAVKTIEARLDGQAAGAAPVIAKSIVRSAAIAPVAAVAPVSYAAPVAAVAAPVSYAAQVAAPVSYAAHVAAPVSYAAQVAAPVSYAAQVAAPVSYAAPVAAPLSYAAPAFSAPVAYEAPLAYGALAPSLYSAPLNYGHAW